MGCLPGIECIFNAYSVIKARLDHDPDVSRHNMLKVEYSTDFGGMSVRYTELLEQQLIAKGYSWRVHSAHVDLEAKLNKILLRAPGLADLITPDTDFSPLEVRLLDLLRDLAVAMDKEPITSRPADLEWPLHYYLLPSPSTLRVWNMSPDNAKSGPKEHRLIFKNIFDVWYYDGNTWEHASRDGMERTTGLARELSGLSP